MRKLLLCAVMLLAFTATALPSPTCPDLGLPPGTEVNVHGHGVFDQAFFLEDDVTAPIRTRGVIFDSNGRPVALVPGTELFGVANIEVIDAVGSGNILWTPPAGTEMTLSFWDAFVTSSATVFDSPTTRIIETTYADDALVNLIWEDTSDYNTTAGPLPFDLANGFYPTVYEAADPDEMVFLQLSLSNNESTLTWDKVHNRFLSASFDSTDVKILVGCGADQFASAVGGHGDVFTLNLGPKDWLYNADTDIQFNTVPAPTALFSLFSGLALLGGYRLRRK